MKDSPGFMTCGNKGFHINFPNGLTLSTQFGGGNYSSNYHGRIGSKEDQSATTVEIAVFKSAADRKWITKEIAKAAGFNDQTDDVMGYIPFIDWLRIFDATRNWAERENSEKQ